MERLTITKLIVISQNESSSLEIPFGGGLNIICGGNKTGKSSIIKSVFTAFGCECRHVEDEWKALISSFLVFFQYGNNSYCILREKNEFNIFHDKESGFVCLFNSTHYHEYSNALMAILKINMPCVSKDGKEFNITPPLLFRFQYIDQDDGWRKIGDSFSNVGYIKDWAANTNKYVCGYLDEKYYALRTQIVQLQIKKDDIKSELQHNKQFVDRLSNSLQKSNDIENPEQLEAYLNSLIDSLDIDRKHQIELREQISTYENAIFISQHQQHILQDSIQETRADIDFAMTQDDELICPTCGTHYKNQLSEQLNISSDFALNEKLLIALAQELEELSNQLEQFQKDYMLLNEKVFNASTEINKTKNLLAFSSFYRNEGKQELYESCLFQLDELNGQFETQISKIASLEEQVKDLKSSKRAKSIKEDIENHCRAMAELIDIPKTFIKLRDFVQIINKTGSETPRLVYMYQTALYHYNLIRANSPFNFLVIDTPNQQGQDEINLENIHNSLNSFLSTDGQVILGTERETGLESSATHVVHLTEKRRCLSKKNFDAHIELINMLLKKGREWTHNKHIQEQVIDN